MKNPCFRDEEPFGAINLCDECLHCGMNVKHKVSSLIKIDGDKDFSVLNDKADLCDRKVNIGCWSVGFSKQAI